MRNGFKRFTTGMQAYMPAGATWDWTIDETTALTALADTIQSATWSLAEDLTGGAITTDTVKSSIFITAPATPSATPYRCTLTYTTAAGRVTPKTFLLYVLDPLLFVY
jgi:hypothetical protein